MHGPYCEHSPGTARREVQRGLWWCILRLWRNSRCTICCCTRGNTCLCVSSQFQMGDSLFYLSIRSLLELRLHPVPNWGQARLMRLGQTGMSVKLLSLGKGLVQGHYSARGVGKARWCWPQYSGFDFVGPGSLHVCVREKVCANWQDHSLSDSQCSQPLCQP